MTTPKTTDAPAGSQPANLSTRQLARSLIQSTAAAHTTPTGKDGDPTPSRIPAPADPPPDPDPNTDPANPPPAEPAPAADPSDPATADPSDPADPADPANTDDPAAPADPDNASQDDPPPPAAISDAVAQRLSSELAPLIEELQQSGAKGALQILQKRIPKLVDQRDTERNARLQAEEQAAALRRELQEAKEAKPAQQDGPAFQHPQVAKVANELKVVDHWLAVCEDALPQLQSGEIESLDVPDGKGNSIKLSAKQVAALHRDMQNQRTELVAERKVVEQQAKAAWNQLHQEAHTQAAAAYPWLNNANAPETREFQAVLSAFPSFKQSPDYELAIADFIAGKNLRLAKAKAKGNGAVLHKAPPPRNPTKVLTDPPSGAAGREPAPDKEAKAAEAQFKKSGKTTDLAKWNAAKARAIRVAT